MILCSPGIYVKYTQCTLLHVFELIASPLAALLHNIHSVSSLFWHLCYTVNKRFVLQFALLHIEYRKDLSTGAAADPSAELMSYQYCLVNRLAPQSRLAGSPCFGMVIIGCMLW